MGKTRAWEPKGTPFYIFAFPALADEVNIVKNRVAGAIGKGI